LALLIFLPLSGLIYFALYRSVVNGDSRTDGKTSGRTIKNAEAYASRAAIVVLFLFPTASVLGAWSFSKLNTPTAIISILFGGMILAYVHAKLITPVNVPRGPWRISKWVSQHVCNLKRQGTKKLRKGE